jgi:hypothetical protein
LNRAAKHTTPQASPAIYMLSCLFELNNACI